ncbi:ABC transporter permease subunit [Streptosporangium sp. NBC_01639]|uniref:ABC transporter permease n=1 Tax=Streptosporangium sp. NBC_01639 TaxID=2975948 RepID=UPI00386A2B81|nr:ABC transporter permease subunit [Streptosporangium sp. NBC_01639]
MNRTRVIRGVIGVCAAVALAEAIARLGIVDPEIVPPISAVLLRSVTLAGDPVFLAGVTDTVLAWLAGLALAAVAAVVLGVLLGSVPWLSAPSRMVVEFLRPIPSVALIPLAILLFGSEMEMKVSLIFYAAIWPILFNTLYALRDVDPVAKDAMRSFGFGPLAVLWRVSLPSAAPFVATGVRVAAGVALVVVVGAELLSGGQSGLGIFLIDAGSAGGNTDVTLAGAVWAGVLGLIVNTLLVRVERGAFRWHFARTERTR